MFIKCSNKSIPIPFPLILLPISHSSLSISPSPTSKFNLFPYLDPAGAGTTASTVAGSRAIAAKAVLLDPTSWLLKYIWLSTFNKKKQFKNEWEFFNFKSSHIKNYYRMIQLCDQSSKILDNRLPEATGIFRLASKSIKFHVNDGVRAWWQT